MKERWEKRRNTAEVMVTETMPPDIVCDCGSAGVPRNVNRAGYISSLPELVRFVRLCLKHGDTIEKVSGKTFHIQLDNKEMLRVRGVMERVGLIEVKQ